MKLFARNAGKIPGKSGDVGRFHPLKSERFVKSGPMFFGPSLNVSNTGDSGKESEPYFRIERE